MKFARITLAAALLGAMSSGAALAQMQVQLTGGWNGKTVPAGQQCSQFGGEGMSPPMKVSGLPEKTAWIYVEFNDRDYKPLSTKGGHGVIGYPVKGNSATLKSVPERKKKLPGNARVIKKARSSGKYASSGYLAPCSGGRGNRYFADVKAISADGKTLETIRVEIGKY